MRKGYYPEFYEVYVERFFSPPAGGRGYSDGGKVVKSGMGEFEAKAYARELSRQYSGDYYVGARLSKA